MWCAQLRKELATLRAQQQQSEGRNALGGTSEALKAVSPPAFYPPAHARDRARSLRCCPPQARIEKERKEAEKAEVVAQANAQKQVLATEVRQLQADIRRLQVLSSSNQQRTPARMASAGALPDSVAEALAQRKVFEETFSKTLRSLREELMDTSIKRLSSRSQTPQGIRALLLLSDERIDRIMEEALRVSSP